MATRRYTVDCIEHGSMERDQIRFGWRCTSGGCTAFLGDEDVHRLVTGARDAPEPVPLVVTGAQQALP